jgi:hypothetical protein
MGSDQSDLCIHVYVCMYVCMHVCMHKVPPQTHEYVCIQIWMHLTAHSHPEFTSTCVCIHVYMYLMLTHILSAHAHVCIHMYMCSVLPTQESLLKFVNFAIHKFCNWWILKLVKFAIGEFWNWWSLKLVKFEIGEFWNWWIQVRYVSRLRQTDLMQGLLRQMRDPDPLPRLAAAKALKSIAPPNSSKDALMVSKHLLHTHTYIHTYMHTYIHTCIHTNLLLHLIAQRMLSWWVST